MIILSLFKKGMPLVLLLICTFCYAQGYITDQSGTCKTYTTANTEKRNFTYTGSCKDGYVNGNATVTMYEDGKQFAVITGSFTKGKLNGECTMAFSDGSSFKGQCIEGIKKQGTYKYATGARYEGEWDITGRAGKGTYYLPQGSEYYKYVGDFKNDAFNGYGVYYYADGSVGLKGQFTNGLPNGVIEEFFKNGARFSGISENSWWTGEGTVFFTTGTKYHGIFDHDVSSSGTLSYDDGTVKEASWPNRCEKIEESCVRLKEAPNRISDDSEFDDPDYKGQVNKYRSTHKIQTGTLFFSTRLIGETGILLYHSDDPEKLFVYQVISEGESATIMRDGKQLVLGNDWMVRVYNEYKGTTGRYFIGDIAEKSGSGFTIYSNALAFQKEYRSVPGNSFTSSTAAAEYLFDNFYTTKTKKGNMLVDPMLLDVTDSKYLYFIHTKGTVAEEDVIRKNEKSRSSVEADETQDEDEYAMQWSSINKFSFDKRSTGDYYLTIFGTVEDANGNKKADHITLYVPAAKKEKIKNALDYLHQYPCTTLDEIARLQDIYNAKADKEKADKKTAQEQAHKDYIRTLFKSADDARNYLAGNFSKAYSYKYYVEISYSLSGISFRFKTYNESQHTIGNVITNMYLAWRQIESPDYRERQEGNFHITFRTKDNLDITPDNSKSLELYWDGLYFEKAVKISNAVEYLRLFE